MAEPRYPLVVALPGGRVRHAARLLDDGIHVITLCRKRGTPANGDGLPYCQKCRILPNPISQQGSLDVKGASSE